KSWFRAPDLAGRSLERKVEGALAGLLIRSEKREFGRLPDDNSVPWHQLCREEVLVSGCVDVEAVSVEILGYETDLVGLGIDRFGESWRINFAESQRRNVIHVRDAAKSVEKILSVPDRLDALAWGTICLNLVLVIYPEIVHPELGLIAGCRPELSSSGKPSKAVILQTQQQVHAGTDSPEKARAYDGPLLRRSPNVWKQEPGMARLAGNGGTHDGEVEKRDAQESDDRTTRYGLVVQLHLGVAGGKGPTLCFAIASRKPAMFHRVRILIQALNLLTLDVKGALRVKHLRSVSLDVIGILRVSRLGRPARGVDVAAAV